MMPNVSVVALASVLLSSSAAGQFKDDFASLELDPRGVSGWASFTGDGLAEMTLAPAIGGFASIHVNATKDRQGIWWALIRRRVSENMDLSRLNDPKHELRIEARIRISHAPRRVNLHLNTQRTMDFHSHLMEFDVPDTVQWHTISMTTSGFDALQGDTVYGQLALMDWGFEQYQVDLGYLKVDIVNVDSAGPDSGVQVPYHPPVPDVSSFAHHIPVFQDAVVDRMYPDHCLRQWSSREGGGRINLLAAGGSQFSILRWDLSSFEGRRILGFGLLELTTYSLLRSPEYRKDFGMVRIVEILGGDPHWHADSVTYAGLCAGENETKVLNPQMITDIEVADTEGEKTFAVISNPVLQRMIDGKTTGLALLPLGAVHASFYAKYKQNGTRAVTLHLSTE